MSALIILLLILSIILFIVSFFQKDQSSNVKKELDDLSMNLYQTYQMNKRIKVLEEELLVDDQLMKKELSKSDKPIVNEILRNQVIALFKQGFKR